MATYPSATHAIDVARWLERRRNMGHSTTLFLGARAGGLFRSKTLYSTSQYFSPRTFTSMSRIEQFGECYRVLRQEDFSKSDIDTILIASLQGLEVSEIDIYLSELIKAGIFDTIISTNIDNILTRAFQKVGMKEARDFQVFIPQIDFIEDIIQSPSKPFCLLIKAFGDLATVEYNLIRHDLYLDTHEKLKAFLGSLLQGHVLMQGTVLQQIVERTIQQIVIEPHEYFLVFREDFLGDQEMQAALHVYSNMVISMIYRHLASLNRQIASEVSRSEQFFYLREFLYYLMLDPIPPNMISLLRYNVQQIIEVEPVDICIRLYEELSQDVKIKERLGEHITILSLLLKP